MSEPILSQANCPWDTCPTPNSCSESCNHNVRVAAMEAAGRVSDEWAIVEIIGRRALAGRVRGEERFGLSVLRVDVPSDDEWAMHGWHTTFFVSASVFSIHLCTAATAQDFNKRREPVTGYYSDESRKRPDSAS